MTLLFVQPAKRIGAHGCGKSGIRKSSTIWVPTASAWVSAQFGKRASRLQTGYLYHYAFAMLIGLVLIVGGVMFMMGKHG